MTPVGSSAALRASEALRDEALEQQRQADLLGPRVDALTQRLRSYDVATLLRITVVR